MHLACLNMYRYVMRSMSAWFWCAVVLSQPLSIYILWYMQLRLPILALWGSMELVFQKIYIYHSNNKYKYRYIHIYIHIYVCTFLHWTLYIYIFFYGSSRSVCWILDRAFQSQFTITVDCYELGVSQKRRRVDCYQRMYWSDRIGLNMVLKNRFNGGRMIYSIAWFPALLTEYFNSNWTFKVDFGEMIIS